VQIKFVKRGDLEPYYGYAVPRTQTAYVREDLRGQFKRFVVAHETYHLRDKARGYWRREFRATFLLDWRFFPGFVAAIIKNLTPARLKLTWRRIRGHAPIPRCVQRDMPSRA